VPDEEMKLDQLPADLQKWLRTMVAGRYGREQVLQALLASGYTQDYAAAVVTLAYDDATPQPLALAPSLAPAVQAATEEADAPLTVQLASTPNTLVTPDRSVEMLFALAEPRIVLFGNLLAGDECDALVTMSRGKLARSSVVNTATGSYDVHPHRTSLGTYFQRGENELIRRIEQRIAELVQCEVERGEPLQILHYQPGGEYKPHHDYFDPAHPGNEQVLAHGGQRIATLIMYLNDVEAGGSTVFPQIGLDVLPRKGHAVYFAYCAENGALDPRSLHGGSPVAAGEKWIATKWFRQRTYGGPGA
jgi:prolyl 4-hydroxylase